MSLGSGKRAAPRWIWAGTLIALSVMLRLRVVWPLPPFQSPPAGGYPQALHDHLLQFLSQATLLPPLNYLVQALPIALLGPEGNASHHGHLYVNFAMDIGAVWFLYRAMLLAEVPIVLSWALALATSVDLVPFELWRANYAGAHYDQCTPVLASFLVFSSVRAARRGLDRRGIAIATGAGVLLIMQLPTAAYFVPALFVLMLVTERLTGRLGSRARAKTAALLGPALFAVAMLGARNGLAAGVPAPGAKGGAALMMFVQSALESQPASVRQVVLESGAPSWYLWCYDHPSLPTGVLPGTLWDRLAPAFGICMPWGAAPNIAGKPWPFEFDGLIRELETARRPDLAAWVARDQSDSLSRQYLFMGHSPELSPRWIAIYGQQSQRVGLHLLRTRPGLYYQTMRKHHNQLFWGMGPEFPARTGGELRTLEYPYRVGLARFARFWFPAVPRAAYLVLPYACAFALIAVVVSRRRGWDVEHASEVLRIHLYLGFPVLISALFYSGAVAVENDRYFVHVLPYLVATFGIMSTQAARAVIRRA